MNFKDLGKIPFGYNPNRDIFVDVYEVDRGSNSGCICPSCNLPLIANHGEVKDWYFSHNTRGSDKKAAKDCEFSFFVSVKNMVKQIFGEITATPITLPTYRKEVDALIAGISGKSTDVIVVTEGRIVELNDIKLDVTLPNSQVDIAGKVKGVDLYFCLTHPNSKKDLPIIENIGHKAGLLVLDLTNTYQLLKQESNTSFKERLKEYVLNSSDSKEWKYHPNEFRMVKKKEKELEKLHWKRSDALIKKRKERAAETTLDTNSIFAGIGGDTKRVCGHCRNTFFGSYFGKNVCPQCSK